MKLSAKHIVIISGGFFALLMLFIIAQTSARHLFIKSMHEHGYTGLKFKSVFLYSDGLVVKDVQLTPQICVNRLYLQGNPLSLWLSGPKRIWAEKLQVDTAALFNDQLHWPIGKKTIFDVDQLVAKTTLWNQPIVLTGTLKQDNLSRAVFTLRSKDKKLLTTIQGEILIKDSFVKTVNLDVDRMRMNIAPVDARRVIAWVSLEQKKTWQIAGEANAGSLDIGDLKFLDSSLKIQGDLRHPVIDFTTLNRVTKDVWVYDGGQLITGNNRQTIDLNLRDMNSIEALSVQAADNQKIKVPVAKPQPKKITTKTEKPTQVPHEEVLQEIELVPLSFGHLVEKSLFRGFYYTKELTVMPSECAGGADCWTARGVGGIFGFEEQSLPAYLMRLKNYEQATQLKTVLSQLSVSSLRLNGKGDTIEVMIIKGETAEGRPVHIELSINDVE